MELLLNANRTILITGGAGFIGSHVVNHFVKNYPEYKIINLDKLTYASDLSTLKHLDCKNNYKFIQGDICDTQFLQELFKRENINGVIHLAAESHVDNSITNPMEFVNTNIIGTVNLLNECIKYDIDRFYHVSTDEVYGDLGLEDDPFLETTPYDPKSPYSASKASSDHFVRAYGNTYKLPFVISNCSTNIGIVKEICKQIENKLPEYSNLERLISFVEDRAGHDFRYAIDCHKIINKLGWTPQTKFNEGMSKTIEWYIDKYFANTK